MAKDINSVFLSGRLGGDPELKYTPNGVAVCNFSTAVNRSVKRGDQWENETDWIKIITWGKLAEICGEYLTKGSEVFIKGSLQVRSWVDKEGNKRCLTEVVAKEVKFFSKKGGKPESAKGEGGGPSGPETGDCPF
jgi:single-strand DNA-binding protein